MAQPLVCLTRVSAAGFSPACERGGSGMQPWAPFCALQVIFGATGSRFSSCLWTRVTLPSRLGITASWAMRPDPRLGEVVQLRRDPIGEKNLTLPHGHVNAPHMHTRARAHTPVPYISICAGTSREGPGGDTLKNGGD